MVEGHSGRYCKLGRGGRALCLKSQHGHLEVDGHGLPPTWPPASYVQKIAIAPLCNEKLKGSASVSCPHVTDIAGHRKLRPSSYIP